VMPTTVPAASVKSPADSRSDAGLGITLNSGAAGTLAAPQQTTINIPAMILFI
jgi:hypothetical protein